MSTSDIDISGKAAKTAFVYLLASLLCAVFGAVYEVFSHEVFSFYMIYAFMFLLVLGTLPFLLISLIRPKQYPGAVAGNLYHLGVVTLTVGSVIQGILDIYGTSNSLSVVYWYLGGILVLLGIISWKFSSIRLL